MTFIVLVLLLIYICLGGYMKIKNLKVYLLGALLLTNASFSISCSLIDEENDRIKNKDLYDFLDENDITLITELHDIPRNYYEAEVADYKYVGDELTFDTHYQRLKNIDNVVCKAREFDYDYKVLKIERIKDGFKIDSRVIEDIDLIEPGYDYVYCDDYVIEDGFSDVLIKNGQVIKR